MKEDEKVIFFFVGGKIKYSSEFIENVISEYKNGANYLYLKEKYNIINIISMAKKKILSCIEKKKR